MEDRRTDEIKAELNELLRQPHDVLYASVFGRTVVRRLPSKLYWRCGNEQSKDKVVSCCIPGVCEHASH
jgi:hypothetical protein